MRPPTNLRLLHLLLLSVLSLDAGQDAVVEVVGASGVSVEKIGAVRRLAHWSLERLAPSFPAPPRAFKVVVHPSGSSLPPDVRRNLHEGTAGVALLAAQQVHLILDRTGVQPPDDLRTVVLHEIAHILLHQHAGPHVPRWFHEGLAQALTGSTYLGVSEEDIAFYAHTNNLLQFSKLRRRFPRRPAGLRLAYAQSYSFVSFLNRQVGLPALLDTAARCAPDRTFIEAFEEVVGRSLVELEEEWVEYVKTGSGAAWRVLLSSCFALSMVLVLPLLVLAGTRRWNRDLKSRRRLEVGEGMDPSHGDQRPGSTP